MFIERIAALGDDPFPSLTTGALPGSGIVDGLYSVEGWNDRQCAQKRLALVEPKCRHTTPVDPQDVEHVVAVVATPRELSVEHELVVRQSCERLRDVGCRLR